MKTKQTNKNNRWLDGRDTKTVNPLNSLFVYSGFLSMWLVYFFDENKVVCEQSLLQLELHANSFWIVYEAYVLSFEPDVLKWMQ